MRAPSSLPTSLWLLAAFPLLLGTGCPSGGSTGDDDDDDSTPIEQGDDDDDDDSTGDDDDDDDDTTPTGPPSWSWDGTELAAGEWAQFTVEIENFDVASAEITSDPELLTLNFTDAGGGAYVIEVMPGMLADGTYTFSVTAGADVLEQSLTVTPVAATALDFTMDAGEALLAEERGYAIYSVTTTEPGQFIYLRARDMGNADFHPYLWLFGADGLTNLGAAGVPVEEVYPEAPVLAWAAPDAGTWFVRVDDYDFLGGGDYSCIFDLAAIPMGAAVTVPEVEPNDLEEEWQDLGTLATGQWTLTGAAATAGHDAKTNDPSGDFDGFTFSVDAETQLSLEMTWADAANDFDLLVFDISEGAPEISFESEALVATNTASVALPEVGTATLAAGSYLLVVTEWDGTPADWTLEVTLAPAAFPGE